MILAANEMRVDLLNNEAIASDEYQAMRHDFNGLADRVPAVSSWCLVCRY
jgi:hypothetical protein